MSRAKIFAISTGLVNFSLTYVDISEAFRGRTKELKGPQVGHGWLKFSNLVLNFAYLHYPTLANFQFKF
jgi:hypothetical protein